MRQESRFVLNFTPHLVPMNRGILVTAYATLAKDVTYGRGKELLTTSIMKDEYFVRVLDKDVVSGNHAGWKAAILWM